jgi:hypothetical protein
MKHKFSEDFPQANISTYIQYYYFLLITWLKVSNLLTAWRRLSQNCDFGYFKLDMYIYIFN